MMKGRLYFQSFGFQETSLASAEGKNKEVGTSVRPNGGVEGTQIRCQGRKWAKTDSKKKHV
jgi:hypothetical protein